MLAWRLQVAWSGSGAWSATASSAATHAEVDAHALGVGLQAMISVRLQHHSHDSVEAFRSHAPRARGGITGLSRRRRE